MITNLLINTDVSPVGQKPLSRTIFREVGLVGPFEIIYNLYVYKLTYIKCI